MVNAAPPPVAAPGKPFLDHIYRHNRRANLHSWNKPTDIQNEVYDAVRRGDDIIVHEKPGADRLAVALFPIITILMEHPKLRCLLFCETSVRAAAVDEDVRLLVHNLGITSVALYGLSEGQKRSPNNELWLSMRSKAATARIVVATLDGIEQHFKKGDLEPGCFRIVAFDQFDFSIHGLHHDQTGKLAMVLASLSPKAKRLFWSYSADGDSSAVGFAKSLCRVDRTVTSIGKPSSPEERRAKIEHHVVRFPAPPHTTPRRLEWLQSFLQSHGEKEYKILVFVSIWPRTKLIQESMEEKFGRQGKHIRCSRLRLVDYSYNSSRFYHSRAMLITHDPYATGRPEYLTAIINFDSPHTATAFFNRAQMAVQLCNSRVMSCPVYTLVNDQPLDTAGWNHFTSTFALDAKTHASTEFGAHTV